MNEKKPYVSVVIPAYKDNDRLKLCLKALSKQTYDSTNYEILVTNNSPDDDISGVTKNFKNVKLLVEKKKGSYAARNKAISIAKGDILAFTDSDCIPMSTWIENGVNELVSDKDISLIGGHIELFFKNANHRSLAELYEEAFSFKQKNYIEKVHFGATANVFTYKSVFEKVGLFNDELQSSGDLDWGNRVYNAGLKMRFSDKVIVKHPARYYLKDLKRKHKRIVKGQFAIDWSYKKNTGKNSPPSAFFRSTTKKIKQYWKTASSNSNYSLWDRLRLFYVYYTIKKVQEKERKKLTKESMS